MSSFLIKVAVSVFGFACFSLPWDLGDFGYFIAAVMALGPFLYELSCWMERGREAAQLKEAAPQAATPENLYLRMLVDKIAYHRELSEAMGVEWDAAGDDDDSVAEEDCDPNELADDEEWEEEWKPTGRWKKVKVNS